MVSGNFSERIEHSVISENIPIAWVEIIIHIC